MKITKYGHACLLVEQDGKRLVIDPGNYSEDLGAPQDVVAIMATHAHTDHLGLEIVKALYAANPEVIVYGPAEVVKALEGVTGLATQLATVGSDIVVGPFTLSFYGGKHADIRPGVPGTENLGIMVNQTLYFPGDSLDVPDVAVPILAAPTSGPWLKIGDTVDFILRIKPARCFPTHNIFLSELGQKGTDSWVQKAVAPGTEYAALTDGASLEA